MKKSYVNGRKSLYTITLGVNSLKKIKKVSEIFRIKHNFRDRQVISSDACLTYLKNGKCYRDETWLDGWGRINAFIFLQATLIPGSQLRGRGALIVGKGRPKSFQQSKCRRFSACGIENKLFFLLDA